MSDIIEFKNPDPVYNAIADFWSGFGVPAYLAGRIPRNQKPPYITFTYNQAPYAKTAETARVMTYSATAQALDSLTGRIARAIPAEGLLITLPDGAGAVRITRNQPFVEMRGSDDEMEKARTISYSVTSYVI